MEKGVVYWMSLLVCLLLTGCAGDTGSTGSQGSATDKADLKMYNPSTVIGVDETFEPIISQEIAVFENIYDQFDLDARYVPENEAFDLMMKDSVRNIVVTRGLNMEEKTFFNSKKITVKQLEVAIDAIAFITNNENKCTYLKRKEVGDILTGRLRNWSAIDAKYAQEGRNDSIIVAFDHTGSSTVRYVFEEILEEGETLSKNVFAAKSNPEVVEYVARTPGAVGVIGMNWISDYEDSLTTEILSKISVLKIEAPEGSEFEGEYYQPYQESIAEGSYPFLRKIYVLSSEYMKNSGTGFAVFLAGDEGQRVILKSGLYPARPPQRVVVLPPKEK